MLRWSQHGRSSKTVSYLEVQPIRILWARRLLYIEMTLICWKALVMEGWREEWTVRRKSCGAIFVLTPPSPIVPVLHETLSEACPSESGGGVLLSFSNGVYDSQTCL